MCLTNPIERFTKKGIVANDIEYEFDSVVCATGFAAMTGSFDKIQITGRDGLTLKEKMERWASYLSRPIIQWLPKSIHDHRPRQSFCTREYDPGDRTTRRLDC